MTLIGIIDLFLPDNLSLIFFKYILTNFKFELSLPNFLKYFFALIKLPV
ncbi:Uncharacterised protein [Clostridioides difficile]|nr:Uncharacterised protein [Clostridioides difficile]